MNNICVLLSTYNGESFIREQLDSLINQKDVELKILIRDDGSKDNTLKVIDEYISKYNNIQFDKGSNLGPAKSFLKLLKIAPDSDYYAFSDQDDVWLDNKLSKAIEKIKETEESSIPVLYHSCLTLTDSKLNPISTADCVKLKGKNSRFTTLVDNTVTGCSVVINKPLKELLVNHLPNEVTMHDAWCNIVASFFGRVVYDNDSYILYRQHEKNTIGMKKTNLSQSLKTHLERLTERSLQPRLMNAKSFLSCYTSFLTDYDRRKVEKIVYYKKSLLSRLSLLFDYSIHSYSFKNDLKYRVLILLGEI